MTTFEKIVAVLNLIAVLLIPVVAVIVGQYLQERVQKRKDKMQIFQCLMTCRITGWAALEAVNAINSIDIIFTDNKEIRNQLGVWKSKCRKDIPSEEQYRERCKLLELMANDLGYKDKITWDIIQNPYYPEGLNQQLMVMCAPPASFLTERCAILASRPGALKPVPTSKKHNALS